MIVSGESSTFKICNFFLKCERSRSGDIYKNYSVGKIGLQNAN